MVRFYFKPQSSKFKVAARYNVFVQRILALDLGRRRIGIAVSDPLGMTAQGLATLERKNKRTDLEALKRLADENDVALIVMGNPLHMSGRSGVQAEYASAFAEDLRRYTGREVRMWDERLTTVEAQRVLRDSGIGQQKRAAAIDRLSAVLILQNFLDSQSALQAMGGESHE